MSPWRKLLAAVGPVVLVCGALTVVGAGLLGVASAEYSRSAAKSLMAGREALGSEDYARAYAHFKAVLDEVPESGTAAQGAACTLWSMGDGDEAMVMQQIAIANGSSFRTPGSCYPSETPAQLFREISVPGATLLYKVPTDDGSWEALAQARASSNPHQQVAAIACVNERGGAPALALSQLVIAQGLAPSAQHLERLAADYEECVG